jgi:serine/threonine protein kinase
MGSVFRARRMFIEDFVAIKFIRPDFLANGEIRQRFYQEAQVAARIKHPNVVSVYDFGETAEGLVYFVMEFLEGMSLGQRLIKHGPLTLDRVLELGTQICAALACMLANNVIHRDLKPDNIMLVKDEHGNEMVKVVDFGVAKILESNARLTRYQARIGSPVYSSPEQYLGKTVDHRTDLYSLGVIFYECLTGRVPFDSPNENALIAAIVEKTPARLDETLTGFPGGMADLVQQLLAKNPQDRPRSAAEVGRCLQRLRQNPQAQHVFRFNRKADKREAAMNGQAPAELAPAAAIPAGNAPSAGNPDKPMPSPNSPSSKKSTGDYGALRQVPPTNGAAKLRSGRRRSYRLWQSVFIIAVFLLAASFLSWAIVREPAAQAYAMQNLRRLLDLADRFVAKQEINAGTARRETSASSDFGELSQAVEPPAGTAAQSQPERPIADLRPRANSPSPNLAANYGRAVDNSGS